MLGARANTPLPDEANFACLTGEPESAPNNHSPLAAFDDGVLADAAALLAELATRRLAGAGPTSTG